MTKKAKRAWCGVVERKWHNEIVFLQVFIYVFCDVFKARGVYVCVCIKTIFCASFWKQELYVVASWDLGYILYEFLKARVVCGCIMGSRLHERRFTRRKGCHLALSFQCWSLVWVTLTIAQSSTWEDNNKAKDKVTWRITLKQPKINQEIHVYSL